MAVVSAALGFLHRPRQVLELDHLRYIAMAREPPGRAQDPLARERPFCFRILVPALVHEIVKASGLGLHAVFWTATQLALLVYLLTLFLYLRALGFALGGALLGTLLAGLTPGAVRWYAYQYWMPDPLCLWLVTLGLVIARSERLLGLGAVACAAALTRESWLFVPAHAFMRRLRLGPGRGLASLFLAFVPAALAAIVVRVVVEPASGPTLLAAAREMLEFRGRHLLDNQLYFATLGSFGVLVPLLLLRAPRALRAMGERPEDAAIVLLAYASLAFANNTDRLLVYALPAVLPPALRAVDAVGRVVGIAAARAVVLGAQACVYAVTPGWGIAGLSVYQPVSWTVVLLCAALLAVGLLALRRYSS